MMLPEYASKMAAWETLGKPNAIIWPGMPLRRSTPCMTLPEDPCDMLGWETLGKLRVTTIPDSAYASEMPAWAIIEKPEAIVLSASASKS